MRPAFPSLFMRGIVRVGAPKLLFTRGLAAPPPADPSARNICLHFVVTALWAPPRHTEQSVVPSATRSILNTGRSSVRRGFYLAATRRRLFIPTETDDNVPGIPSFRCEPGICDEIACR